MQRWLRSIDSPVISKTSLVATGGAVFGLQQRHTIGASPYSMLQSPALRPISRNCPFSSVWELIGSRSDCRTTIARPTSGWPAESTTCPESMPPVLSSTSLIAGFMGERTSCSPLPINPPATSSCVGITEVSKVRTKTIQHVRMFTFMKTRSIVVPVSVCSRKSRDEYGLTSMH